MVYHELVSLVEVALIVAGRARGFVVHNHLHALGGGIAVDFFDVEVGIGGDEVEHVVLLVAEPVLPAYVPSLDEDGIEAMLGGEVDVALHVLGVGGVGAVGLGVGVVGFAELHGGEVVGVAPGALVGDHVPPYADILRGLNPGGVLYLAGLVEVEGDAGGKDVRSLVADDDGAPGADAGSLKVALVAACVGGEPALEGHGLLVVVEVHGGIVDAGGLVEVDVESVIAFHL